MDFQDVLFQILVGLTSAASLFLVGAGLTLVFGAMRVVNVAHGSLYMIGAFAMTSVVAGTTALVPFVLSIVVAAVVAGVVAFGVETTVMRRLYDAGHVSQLLGTLALLLILAEASLLIWGGDFRTVTRPSALSHDVQLLGRQISVYAFLTIAAAAAVGLFLWWLLRRTRFGWEIRAGADDIELLQLAGVNTQLLFTKVFVLGGVLAGLAGALDASRISVAPGLDTAILIPAFVVAVIGGIGSVLGAALGALLLGVVQAVGTLWWPQGTSMFIYIVLILVLLLRPSGLLGRSE